MDSIANSIGYFNRYLYDSLHAQNVDEVNENQTTSPAYHTIAVSFLIATVAIYTIKRVFNRANKPVEDSSELFWNALELNQRPPLPSGPIVFMGVKISDDLALIQKQMFSACDGTSQLFARYMRTKGLKPRTVIDLGCGIGGNSIPLLKQGVNVLAIDKMNDVIEIYSFKLNLQILDSSKSDCIEFNTLKIISNS